MKNLIGKFKDLKTTNKLLLFGCLVVLIAAVVIISIRGTAASSETVNIPNKIVDGISFENATIESENGISTFKADVYNENKSLYQIKYVTINFTYESGNTISVKGYIGDSLLPDAGKKLVVSVDEDLSDVVDLEYVITKPTTENE